MYQPSNQVFNKETLEESYIPSEISIRESQKRKLDQHFKIARNGGSFALILCGDSGTGKTCLVKYLMNHNPSVKAIYVNCWKIDKMNSILYKLLFELGIKFPRQDCVSKLSRLDQVLKKRKVVIILDEIDKLRNKDNLLYNLSESNIGLILIAKNLDFLRNMDERLRSRISGTIIHFNKYTPDEIFTILKSRAIDASLENKITDSILKKISKSCHCNVRVAIKTLKAIAYETSPKEIEKIIEKVIDAEIESKLNDLREHYRLIYSIIKANPNIKSKPLLNQFNIKVKRKKIKPIARRTFTRYVDILIKLDLIESEKVRMRGSSRIFRCV